MNKLIAIVGPTATGKTSLALHLSQTFDAEIVNADSCQIYRYMNIATSKPDPKAYDIVPHHLFDIINPNDDFSVADYQSLAKAAIEDIQNRGKLPILVGGSGQYVWAVLEGWGIPRVPPDTHFRQQMQERSQAEGNEAIFHELEAVDPEGAGNIDRHNLRRVIRALEINHHTGQPPSKLRKNQPPKFDNMVIGLYAERQTLYQRIDERVDQMVAAGLLAEVKHLLEMGYQFSLPSMSSIGYNQIGMYIRGEVSLDTAVQQIKNETHRFVRQQFNWFRREDRRISWFDITAKGYLPEVSGKIKNFLGA